MPALAPLNGKTETEIYWLEPVSLDLFKRQRQAALVKCKKKVAKFS